MALYEVGNCFFHGWGLPHPDYPMAVSYFKLAAESGDRDAQERESAPSRAGLESWATGANFGCRSRARLDTLAGQTGSQEEFVSPPLPSWGPRLIQSATDLGTKLPSGIGRLSRRAHQASVFLGSTRCVLVRRVRKVFD